MHVSFSVILAVLGEVPPDAMALIIHGTKRGSVRIGVSIAPKDLELMLQTGWHVTATSVGMPIGMVRISKTI